MECRKVIQGCKNHYGNIEEITIIDGYKVLYSGSFDKFYKNCDPEMIIYRNEILKRKIAEKAVFNNRKLFVFLEQPTEINDEDYEPITHFFQD